MSVLAGDRLTLVPRRPALVAVARHVLVAQFAVLAALAVGAPSTVPGAVAMGLAAIVLLVVLVRVRGHNAAGWLLRYLRFRVRARRPAQPGPPLAALLPGIRIDTHADRSGNRIGLAGDGTEWIAVLHVGLPAEQRLVDLLDLVARAAGDHELGLARTQLIGTASAPAPGGTPGPDGAVRDWWVAIRFDPRRGNAQALARGGGEPGARRATAAAAIRLSGRLRNEGLRAYPLDGEELRTHLAVSLGVDPVGRDGAGPAAQTWPAWSVGALHQACYRPRRTPRDLPALAGLMTRGAASPALFTTVAALFEQATPRGLPVEVLIRVGVAAPPERIAIRTALNQASTGLGAAVRALGGEHGAGVRATLPLGRAL